MKKGFTLIELLVVVLIIGILAAMAVPQYRKAVYRAQMTEAVVNTKAIYDAQQMYKMANGEYTDNFNDLGYFNHYGCSYEVTGNGVLEVTYDDQYAGVRFYFDEIFDLENFLLLFCKVSPTAPLPSAICGGVCW